MNETESTLSTVLASVNDWLKFAEQKNGALSAIHLAGLSIVLGAFFDKGIQHIAAQLYFGAMAACLAVALLFSLSSFVPVLRHNSRKRRRDFPVDGNFLYFGNLAGCNPESILVAVRASLNLADASPRPLERHIADQIVVNSEIALLKYKTFTISVWLTIAAVFTPPGLAVGAGVIALYRYIDSHISPQS